MKPQAGGTIHIAISAVSAEGLSCNQADKVLELVLAGRKHPGWKSVNAKFTVPSGDIPQEFKNGAKVIRYGIHPG